MKLYICINISILENVISLMRGHGGRDPMEVGFTTICAISA
jgi:hypothetical protein